VSGELLTVVLVAGGAAAASVAGGLIALWRTPTTFYTSLALGFAGGSLLGTIGFEMVPQALGLSRAP
jgi:zinc transporter, ZIP family